MKLFKQKETYLSDKVCLYGDIETDADISIDGEVHGNVLSKKCVSLGETARFEGNIDCDTALICGNFTGTIVAKRLLKVKTPAMIVGDLISDSVCIDSGVAVQGKVFAKNIQADCQPEAATRREERAALAEDRVVAD